MAGAVDSNLSRLYDVQVKNVTASEARKNWFRLLDEVAAGEVVQIRRGTKHIVLRCEPVSEPPEDLPDYSGLVRARAIDEADQWAWEWTDAGLLATEP